MNLIQMEYFLAAAREQNFTSAAKKLFLSQPALSKQIALLEGELNTQLFFRGHRNVTLTRPGRVLYEELGRIADDLQLAMERTRDAASLSDYRVNLGCLETIRTKDFLLPLLQRFQTLHPDCQINTGRHTFRELSHMLDAQQLDFIFTLSFEHAFLEGMGYTCHPVARRHGCLVYSPACPHAEQLRRRDTTLNDAVVVTVGRTVSAGGRDRALDAYRRLNINVREVIETPNIASLISTLQTGRGIALMDRSAVSMAEETLEFCPLPEEEFRFYVLCAWSDRHLNEGGRRFRELVLAQHA